MPESSHGAWPPSPLLWDLGAAAAPEVVWVEAWQRAGTDPRLLAAPFPPPPTHQMGLQCASRQAWTAFVREANEVGKGGVLRGGL